MTEPQNLRSEAAAESGRPNNDIWRREVHSRVAGFRTRRGRRLDGAFSMRFAFPQAEPVAATAEVSIEPPSPEVNTPTGALTGAASEPGLEAASTDLAATYSSVLSAECVPAERPPELTAATGEVEETPSAIPESSAVAAAALQEVIPPPLAEAATGPQPTVPPRARPKRKVIAFPRQPEGAEAGHWLADPVLPEQPRILDVPEELEAYPTTPFLEGLQYEPATQVSASPLDHVELPFRAASRLRRMYAALVDCSLVLMAAAVFAFIAHKMLPDLAFTKPTRLAAALAPLLLWAIYEYLLLVYAGRTAGMQVAGIRLRTFKGRQPSLRHRRNRVLGFYLATASLMMGLLWALVDVDRLCWHDRISGTYLTRLE